MTRARSLYVLYRKEGFCSKRKDGDGLVGKRLAALLILCRCVVAIVEKSPRCGLNVAKAKFPLPDIGTTTQDRGACSTNYV